MTKNAATKEQQNSRPTAQSLAKLCYDSTGSTEGAASRMRDLVLSDKELAEQFRDSAYLTWAHNAVQMHVSALRRENLAPINDDPVASETTVNFAPQRRSYSGHRCVSEATLYDMPMHGGKRLGDCLKADLLNGAAETDLRIATMQRTNAFARAVASAMNIASLTVEQQLSLGKLEQIRKIAK